MDHSTTISLAEIKELLEQSNITETETPQEKLEVPDLTESPFLLAAAVMVFYDPATIRPLGGAFEISERKRLINQLMACSELLSDTENIDMTAEGSNASTGYELRFSLSDELRKQTLRSLYRNQQIINALHTNEDTTLHSENTLQRIFSQCLQGIVPSLYGLNQEELNALYKVSGWLGEIGGAAQLPDRGDILHRIEMVEMFTPMKHLIGDYKDQVFQVMFRGRHKELSTLRSYVGVAPPQGLSETIVRIFDKVWPFNTDEKKPLLIFGQGGIGKSTLLAKFILDHAEAQKKDRFPFVYLDFDRPNLSALEPETLLIEAARVLAIQYRDLSDLSTAFLDYYWKWNDRYVSLTDASQTQSINLKSLEATKQKELDRAAMQGEFVTLIRQLALQESRPFLLVMDTFEEIQYKGTDYVITLYDFIQRLQSEYPLLRTIIAGRAPVPQIETYKLELGDLDREAAQGYLTKVGITNSVDAKTIADQIGGNPLTLKLAAQLVKDYGQKELLGVKADAKQQQKTHNKVLSELELQGFLYKRILGHLHDKEVSKLAHPGMVLRRLTPDLILRVLARPCELEVETYTEAEVLFEKIGREVSLVTKAEPGILRHRTDIRKVMLKLIDQEKRETVRQIHQAAADYYKDKESFSDKAERLYHLLSIDYTREELESLWEEGMQNYLVGSLDELPPRGQAFLLAKIGRETNNSEIWQFADMEDQNRHIAKQAAKLLNTGRPGAALEILEQAMPDKGQEILSFLKVRALTQLGRMDEAYDNARIVLSSYFKDQLPAPILVELQQFMAKQEALRQTTDNPRNSQSAGTGAAGMSTGSDSPADYESFDSDISFNA